MKRSLVYSLALLLSVVSTSPASSSGPYDSSSVHFAQMMITHHQQAVLISGWALKQGEAFDGEYWWPLIHIGILAI